MNAPVGLSAREGRRPPTLAVLLSTIAIAAVAATLGIWSGSRSSSASTGSVVLCTDSKGTVAVRTACRRSERVLPITPGAARSTELSPRTITGPLGSVSRKGGPAPAAANGTAIDTVSLLAETPRIYTRRIRFAAGSPTTQIVSSASGLTDNDDPFDRWNQQCVLPNCPIDVPVLVNRQLYLGPDAIDGLHPVEIDSAHVWQLIDDSGSDFITITLNKDSVVGYLEIEDTKPDGVDTLWSDLDVYVTVVCLPITGLTAAP